MTMASVTLRLYDPSMLFETHDLRGKGSYSGSWVDIKQDSRTWYSLEVAAYQLPDSIIDNVSDSHMTG